VARRGSRNDSSRRARPGSRDEIPCRTRRARVRGPAPWSSSSRDSRPDIASAAIGASSPRTAERASPSARRQSRRNRGSRSRSINAPLNGREGGALSRHRTAQEVLIRTQVGPPATGSFATTVLTASRATGVIYSPLSLFKLSNTPACVKPRRQSAAARPEGPAGVAARVTRHIDPTSAASSMTTAVPSTTCQPR